jgi:plasmid stability protein
MLCVGKQTIQVALEDHEYEQLRVTAEAAGRSVPEYARDALLGLLYSDAGRRREELLRVARISEALNKRLAQ